MTRQYVIADQAQRGHVARMDADYLNRRERLTLFFREQKPLSRNAVCKRSGASESAVGAFMRGRGPRAPRTLSLDTYKKLADWSHWTVAELTAEAAPPTPNDISSRKSRNGQRTGNDSETNLRQDAYGTPDSPESEGDMAADRLLIDILDKIDGLPPTHLSRLKRIIDRIEGAAGHSEPHPHKARTAE